MLARIPRLRIAVAFLAILPSTLATAARAGEPPNPKQPAGPLRESDHAATSVVVLIGEAGRSPELIVVVSELLGRQNIRPHFVLEEQFEPSVLLAENETDARVWVFVRPTSDTKVELYFRGPFGKRFLLRELTPPRGLDEVGRELIAQVVDSSTAALLHSTAGLSREEIKADLARKPDLVESAPVKSNSSPSPAATIGPRATKASRIELLLGVRGVAAHTGSDLGPSLAAGAETGLRIRPRPDSALLGGGHLSFEYGATQSIKTPQLDATFRSIALRAALDIGAASGRNAVIVFALGAGVDLVRIAPTTAGDPSLKLAPTSIATVPAVRAELRYELTLINLRLIGSVFADSSLTHTHYDIVEGDQAVRVASPWLLRPGLSLGVAWSPTIPGP